MKTQLCIKQLVRFPYCRIYRRFLHRLAADPAVRTRGRGLLFYFAMLFGLANYRPALRRIDRCQVSLQAGEWAETYAELCRQLHLRTHRNLRDVLRQLAALQLIEFDDDAKHKFVRFKICCWQKTNTSLSYSAPCSKDTGFFFFPIETVPLLIGAGRCSEADMLLDLWLHTVYQDASVAGSDLCPLVCFRRQRTPLCSCAALAERWGVSKATVHRFFKKFEREGLLTVFHASGNRGSVITLCRYLSTMFCVPDPCPCWRDLALRLEIELPETIDAPALAQDAPSEGPMPAPVCTAPRRVSKTARYVILENLRKALYASGFTCAACPHAYERLSELSGCTEGIHPYDLAIFCRQGGPQFHFSLKLKPAMRFDGVEVEAI